ncbi:MAG: TetR/AcrR family transcriptional regulator [Candidatus Kariarchaeaceae archaeon]
MNKKTVRDKQKEETHNKILDVATELFFAEGFSKTTTSAIGERAGVSKGTIFHHFPTKEDLGLAVLERAMTHFFAVLDLMDELTPKEFITKLMKDSIELGVTAPGFMKMVLYFLINYDEKVVSNFFNKTLVPYVDLFTDYFIKIGVKNPKIKSRLILGLMDGLGLQMMYYRFLDVSVRLGTIEEETELFTKEIIEILDLPEE